MILSKARDLPCFPHVMEEARRGRWETGCLCNYQSSCFPECDSHPDYAKDLGLEISTGARGGITSRSRATRMWVWCHRGLCEKRQGDFKVVLEKAALFLNLVKD